MLNVKHERLSIIAGDDKQSFLVKSSESTLNLPYSRLGGRCLVLSEKIVEKKIYINLDCL